MRTNEDLHCESKRSLWSIHPTQAPLLHRPEDTSAGAWPSRLAGLTLLLARQIGMQLLRKLQRRLTSADGTSSTRRSSLFLTTTKLLDDSLVTNQLNSFVCFAGQAPSMQCSSLRACAL